MSTTLLLPRGIVANPSFLTYSFGNLNDLFIELSKYSPAVYPYPTQNIKPPRTSMSTFARPAKSDDIVHMIRHNKINQTLPTETISPAVSRLMTTSIPSSSKPKKPRHLRHKSDTTGFALRKEIYLQQNQAGDECLYTEHRDDCLLIQDNPISQALIAQSVVKSPQKNREKKIQTEGGKESSRILLKTLTSQSVCSPPQEQKSFDVSTQAQLKFIQKTREISEPNQGFNTIEQTRNKSRDKPPGRQPGSKLMHHPLLSYTKENSPPAATGQIMQNNISSIRRSRIETAPTLNYVTLDLAKIAILLK